MKAQFNDYSSPIYELDDIIDKRIKVQIIYLNFYVLLTMDSILGRKEFDFIHSVERLRKDIREYLNYITDVFSQMLFEYTCLAVFGELRYVGDKNKSEFIKIVNLLLKGQSIANLGERNVYKAYLKHACRFSPESICKTGLILFRDLRWECEYGGNSWATIADIINKYKSLPKEVFIDYCADIEHNGGCYLNKSCGLFNPEIDGLSQLLSSKRYNPLVNFIDAYKQDLDIKTIQLFFHWIRVMEYCLDIKMDELPTTFIQENQLYHFRFYIALADRIRKNMGEWNIAKNNMEIFKLGLYRPIEFGSENLMSQFKFQFKKSHYSFNYHQMSEVELDFYEIPNPNTFDCSEFLPLNRVKFVDTYLGTAVTKIF